MEHDVPAEIHLHYTRGWHLGKPDPVFCDAYECVVFVRKDFENERVGAVMRRAMEAFDKETCVLIGHVDFEYESGSYCGRCGVELSRRNVCGTPSFGHPEIDHGVVTTRGQYSSPTTYPNACKRFGCRCTAYDNSGELL